MDLYAKTVGGSGGPFSFCWGVGARNQRPNRGVGTGPHIRENLLWKVDRKQNRAGPNKKRKPHSRGVEKPLQIKNMLTTHLKNHIKSLACGEKLTVTIGEEEHTIVIPPVKAAAAYLEAIEKRNAKGTIHETEEIPEITEGLTNQQRIERYFALLRRPVAPEIRAAINAFKANNYRQPPVTEVT